jgi:iron complex outermembrane receptor protein
VIVNIPNARIYGLELEGVWRPIDPLTLMLQYSYLNARVSSNFCALDSIDPFAALPGDKTAGCAAQSGGRQPQNLKGAVLPEAPEHKVSFNAQYALKLDPGTLTFSGTFVWKDQTFGSIFNRPFALAPAYSTVNFRATWDDAQGRYTLIGFVNNAFDTRGYDNVTETNAGLAPTLARPQIPFLVSAKGLTPPLTVGAEVQVRFK